MMKKILQKATDKWNSLTSKNKKALILFLGVFIVGAIYLFGRGGKVPVPQAEAENVVSVVISGIEPRMFERFLSVQGNIESKNFAVVSPRIGGTIEEIYVDEGDVVVGGQSMLFKTDSVALKEQVEIQQHLLSVERSARRQAVANQAKVKADFHKAELDFHRFKRLLKKKVVTVDAFEQQQSRYKQLQAAVKLAKASVDLSTANIRKAASDLEISEKNLADSVIIAPISGSISYRFKEPGEMGRPGEPVVRIDDTSLVETSAYLPAQYYTEVVPEQTMVEVVVSGENIGKFPVSYKSPTINPKLRTFEVKCLLDNSARRIAPGAMAQIRVILETKRGLAVPSTAIQHRAGQSIVFAVRDDKALGIEVETGIENDGWTEVFSDRLNEQSMIVTMGQDMLNDGRPVSVQQGGK